MIYLLLERLLLLFIHWDQPVCLNDGASPPHPQENGSVACPWLILCFCCLLHSAEMCQITSLYRCSAHFWFQSCNKRQSWATERQTKPGSWENFRKKNSEHLSNFSRATLYLKNSETSGFFFHWVQTKLPYLPLFLSYGYATFYCLPVRGSVKFRDGQVLKDIFTKLLYFNVSAFILFILIIHNILFLIQMKE